MDPLPLPTTAFIPPAVDNLPILAADIYKVFFHGPAYQVLERGGVDGTTAIGLMSDALPPDTNPTDVASMMAPRLIELCFQTAALWSVQTRQAMAFPLGIESVTVYRQPDEAAGRLDRLCHTADNGETVRCGAGGR